MNGYDFDKTIFDGDSFTRFYFYTLIRRPFLFITFPLYIIPLIMYFFKAIDKRKIKELLMLNLLFFKDREKTVEKFWDKNMYRIKAWYKDLQKPDDIVITASPVFLVKPACDRLGIKTTLGTNMNLKTLKIKGLNCYGQNKVIAFEKVFGKDLTLNAFYSDSLSDLPMMHKSSKGVLVKGDKLQVIYQN